jgi:cytochrome c oxidase cbb3-type subunit 1
MSTFEGPMMSIKTVNALVALHRLDRRPRALRRAGLGGLDLDGLAVLPDPAPVRPQGDVQRAAAIELHFWIATIGIVLYIAAMWIAGVMQGLMWRAVNADGTLTYTFVESVKATYPFYVIRLLGGTLYLLGMLIMALERHQDRCGRPSP